MRGKKNSISFITVAPYALYGVLLFCLFTPVFLGLPNNLISFGDVHKSHFYYLAFLKQQLFSGTIPFWNPYIFAGQPFIANPSISLFYPMTYLLVLFPLTIGFALHFYLHLVWAMSGMFRLLVKVVHPIAAWSAGLIFGISGFFMPFIYEGNYDVVASASWMPWVILSFIHLYKRPSARQIAITSFIVSLQILSGYQTFALFTLEIIFIYTVLISYVHRSYTFWLYLGSVLVLAFGLSAISTLPTQQFVFQTIRSLPKDYSWISYGSMPQSYLLQFIIPFLFGDRGSILHDGIGYWEYALYIGLLPLCSVVYGVICLIRQLLTKKYVSSKYILMYSACVIGVFGLLVSMGVYAPGIDIQYVLWKLIPMYSVLRIPPRHRLLVYFGLSIIAAFGIDKFSLAKRNYRRYILGAYTVFVCVDLLLYAQPFLVTKPNPDARENVPLTQYLQSFSPNYRVYPDIFYTLEYDQATAKQYFSINGYDVVILRNFYEFLNASGNKPNTLSLGMNLPFIDPTSNLMRYLGIRNIVISPQNPLKIKFSVDAFNEKLVNSEGISSLMYQIKTAYPRFWLISNMKFVANRKQADTEIRKGFDYLNSAITYDPNAKKYSPSCQEKNIHVARILSYEPNNIRIETTSSCSGYLVSSELMFPGWNAYIDGIQTDLFESNLAFRTIFIPLGTHVIDFQFTPKIYLISGIISVISIVISLLLYSHTYEKKLN